MENDRISWHQFHLAVANAIKTTGKPRRVCGLSLGGMFAAQFLAAGSGIEITETPTIDGLAIDLWPTPELAAVSSLDIPCVFVWHYPISNLMPWETATGEGPSRHVAGAVAAGAVGGPANPGDLRFFSSFLRELAGYIELNNGGK